MRHYFCAFCALLERLIEACCLASHEESTRVAAFKLQQSGFFLCN